MEIWLKDNDGSIIGVYMDGRLTMHKPVNQDIVGYALFQLLVQFMTPPVVESFGGSLAAPSTPADFDLGTP